MNVLVADQDSNLTLRIMQMVRASGYIADKAETGAETIQKLQEKPFDIVFLNIDLPDIHAQQLIPKIKATRPNAGIVTMTDHNTDELENNIRTLGIIYYMLKPVQQEILRQIIDHIAKKAK